MSTWHENQLFEVHLHPIRCFLWSRTPASHGRSRHWEHSWCGKTLRNFSAKADTFPLGKPTNTRRWRLLHTFSTVAEFASSFFSSHTGGLRRESRRTEYQLFSSFERPLGTDASEKAKKVSALDLGQFFALPVVSSQTCITRNVKLVSFYCRVRILT